MSQSTQELTPGKAIAFGALCVLASAVPVLSALDVIPTPDDKFGAPRWLVAVLASSFTWVGLLLLSMGLNHYVAPIFPRLAVRLTTASGCFAGLLLLAFIGGMLVFLHLQLFAPTGAGSGSVSVGGIPIPLPPAAQAFIDRLFIGLICFIFDAFILLVLWFAIKETLFPNKEQTPTV